MNIYKSINKKNFYNFKNNKSYFSLEAEQLLLGFLIINNEKWYEISKNLESKDFFSKSHCQIFYEMKKLFKLGKSIDLITLSESLEKKNILDKIGGFSYLAELSKNVSIAKNIKNYVKIICEKSKIRKIINLAYEIIENINQKKKINFDKIIEFINFKINKINKNKSNNKNNFKNIEKILEKTINKIEKLFKKSNNGITGIDTGYHDLNKKTLGLQKSDLIILASRPSMGKTTFAMNICENAAMLYNKPILIFSLEMSSEQITMRMLSSLSRVDQFKIKTGQLNENDWNRLYNTISILIKKKNIYIDDSSSLTPNEIRMKIKNIYDLNNGLSLIMIDYLQLLKIPSLSHNRNLEISEISKFLKSLAKEFKVPIIAVSQLNRLLEQRADKRPINSDLRESGSIEQDADLIIFIYRDELYNNNKNNKGIAEIIIGKQRNGPIGKIILTFNNLFSRFDNYIK
ncbi:Replicative DNA helicase [Candidatus Annandia adelgestsuga]|uniref:Replicative DNA helicase n=1 Tax=Candidatus Annandia adelgestsuga TaxID=1302411 RepID=A0A3Q9CLD0_9ENTR|nr:replicative DNA helicase [Candidatus Annandia adelgestsuga]AZP36260.1 Replicative DNA helicase [Candidatus Annandia adelgestsuga]